MEQNLLNLPETAVISVDGVGTLFRIKNHKVAGVRGLFNTMSAVVHHGAWDKAVSDMKSQGFTYESVIERCARELEGNSYVLADFMYGHYNFKRRGTITLPEKASIHDACLDFSESVRGRMIADQIVEKIRDCNNWGELHQIMEKSGKFGTDMKRRIRKECETWLRV